MTAKDKAIEIMSLYRPIINNSMSKECAIIHVKGIIEELSALEDFNSDSFATVVSKRMYWQQVLTELNQM